ncbi:uncharacterized protein LOC118437852 [Folsomia candida]|uniref:uncharacterized protein LOC118437852 n=1 Tax=Folsomia candida TaxID=158441 RepID=UPI001605295C|nr:uncharacterized protein LOC118437852 [Folsomia candida]XP_035713133.1 uncharacterized protein LOC118437852 [Folsomia candida]XP_035713134.1 uncharacterized protein LOC118437852 [Folsomia candida]
MITKITQILLIYLILFALVVPLSRSVWTVPNMFQNCHIIFLTYQFDLSSLDIHHNIPYFHELLCSNPYSPIVHNSFERNDSYMDIIGNHRSIHGPHSASRRVPLIFLNIGSTEKLTNTEIFSIFFDMQYSTMLYLNPSYIFLHTHQPTNPSNYDSYHTCHGIASLFLFSYNQPGKIYIPCITCEWEQIMEISKMDYPLRKIKSIWFSLNNNLHKNMVAVPLLWIYQYSQCDMTNFQPKMTTDFDICAISSLSVKHNFTLVDISLHQSGYYYDFHSNAILHQTLIDLIVRDFYSSYQMGWSNIQFIFVAPFPTALTGIQGLLSPFNTTVWAILIIACVIITLIIVVTDTGRHKVFRFIIDFLNIASILMGQVNGDSFLMFHNKKWVAVPILTVWFLGGRYLTMDNLYVGSIYSF